MITALSALTLFLITLLDNEAHAAAVGPSPAVAAEPDTLDLYAETITIGPDGNAHIEILVVLGSGGQVDLLLPFMDENGEDFSILSGPVTFGGDPSRSAPATVKILGHRLLNLRTTDAAAAGDTIRVTARVDHWFRREDALRPHGEYRLQRGFVNRSAYVFGDFRLRLVLPPGMVVHAVEKVVPDYDPKQSPTPPYALDRSGGRVRATLVASDLAPAGGVRLQLGIRPARRGIIPLIAGLAAALLYLVFFRDVLKPEKAATP